jgi:hypothetical protein
MLIGDLGLGLGSHLEASLVFFGRFPNSFLEAPIVQNFLKARQYWKLAKKVRSFKSSFPPRAHAALEDLAEQLEEKALRAERPDVRAA